MPAAIPPPFPGFDPFLEGSGAWKQFHNAFILTCQRTIPGDLPDNYDRDTEVDLILREPSAEERLAGIADRAVRDEEIDPIRLRPHPYEFDLYYHA